MGVIDQNSEQGKLLQAVIKEELKGYLGTDYSDECLPLYIVVMLAQATKLPAVAENLIAFLGDGKADQFAQWLFEHLEQNPGKYETEEKAAEAVPEPAAETKQPVESTEGGRKRRREKREKIEWKEGEHGKSRHRDREGDARERDPRDEKRRRGRDGEARTERDPSEKGDPDGERDKELRRLRRRQALGGGDDQSRSRREDRSRDRSHREGDRQRHTRISEPPERDEPRRESRRGQERHTERQASLEKPVQLGGRLAGRIGLPGAIQRPSHGASGSLPPPPKEGGRSSVFDRLNKKGEGEPSDHARMRMDAVPAERIDDVTVEPTPDPAPASADPKDMMEELRIIRQSLAKLQAKKEADATLHPAPAPSAAVLAGVRVPVDPSSALAAANARRAVVHNVHFNATPDILKAHFGGCGTIASAIIEKDYQGNSKGSAVIEFVEESARKVALTLSGSLLVGRPITVYAKETAPRPNPVGGFPQPVPAHVVASLSYSHYASGRASAPGRGGRGAGRLRPYLKTNKYVRPKDVPEAPAAAANGGS